MNGNLKMTSENIPVIIGVGQVTKKKLRPSLAVRRWI